MSREVSSTHAALLVVMGIVANGCGGDTGTSSNSQTPQVQGQPSAPSATSTVSTSSESGPTGATSAVVPPGDTGTSGGTGTTAPATSSGATGPTNPSSDATSAAELPDTSEPSEPSDAPPSSTTTGTTGPASSDGPDDTASEDVSSSPPVDLGECTASKAAGNNNVSGSGPYEVVVETNTDPGIREGTIFRPKDLSGDEKFPIFVWGEGGCSTNGLSNSGAMAEIASHGYFVVADGTPNGDGSRNMDSNNVPEMGKPLLAYVDWAIAESQKPCSAYYKKLDATKIAANGFSCGGLMAEGTAGDPRMTTWGINSSGMFAANQALYQSIHTPVLIVLGGPSDIAYENGKRDYDNISKLDVPVLLFSKDIGHGGDLFARGGGDFNKINLAWLNWWLKGDEGATGKGLLVGAGCPYCSDGAWETASSHVP